MARLRTLLTLVVVLGATPDIAAASTVTGDPVTQNIVFSGGPEANDVTNAHYPSDDNPFRSPGTISMWFIDAAQPLNVGAGCLAGLAGVRVWCQGRFELVNLEGGDDRYSGGGNEAFVTVSGGAGKDHIRANHLGSTVYGGSGSDWITAGADGLAVAYGENGDDNIGPVAADGVRFSGGSGNDLVYGAQWYFNELSGGEGDDAMVLGSGRPGTLTAGKGDDVMLHLSGRAGSASYSAGDGKDVIVAGPGSSDSASGGDGADLIDVSGDATQEFVAPDTVECGAGNDIVYADPDDVIADDCERRLDGSMPPNESVNAALVRLRDAFDVTAG